MPKALLSNVSNVGGGLILPPPPPAPNNVFINNQPIVVVSQRIANHGLPPHNNPTMAQGSPNVFAGRAALPVCREGDLATCAHPGAAGSANTFIN